MSKALFTPISVGSGLLAGALAKKLFGVVWGLVDDQEPPRPEHRYVQPPKLIASLLIEGAVFTLVRGLVDHGSRQAFARLTGAWPGDEAPEDD